MNLERTPFGRLHRAFMLAVGTAGWLVLAGGTIVGGWPVGGTSGVDPVSFILFLLFCYSARLLAFGTMQGMAISLDSAFYIAAIWTLGPLPAAWIAAIVVFVDAVWRTLRRDPERVSGARAPWDSAISIYYGAGAVSAQFLLVGWIVPVASVQEQMLLTPAVAHWLVLGTVPFLTLMFLVFNYGTGGLALWLQGRKTSEISDRLLRYGVLAECLQIPLSIAVVQVFRPGEPFNFVILGTTFLLINGVFRRLTQKSASLRDRVGELTVLNSLGRAISSTLHLGELQDKIARNTLSALRQADQLTIGLHDEKAGGFQFITYEREESIPRSRFVSSPEGLSGWVIMRQETLLLGNLAHSDRYPALRPEDGQGSIGSWLGVPMVMYGEVLGVLSLASGDRAFRSNDRDLLQSIAQQAAVAIENARLYDLATIDGLTQLYVRRYFDQRLEEEWRRSTRYRTSFSLILLDLDDFKQLNDEHGHQMGDRVLRDCGNIIRRKMRAADIPARYGGEELALLLPRASASDAGKVAERIRREIAAHPFEFGGTTVRITASIGVASYPESGAAEAAGVLRHADEALYQAKREGKNRVWIRSQEASSWIKVV